MIFTCRCVKGKTIKGNTKILSRPSLSSVPSFSLSLLKILQANNTTPTTTTASSVSLFAAVVRLTPSSAVYRLGQIRLSKKIYPVQQRRLSLHGTIPERLPERTTDVIGFFGGFLGALPLFLFLSPCNNDFVSVVITQCCQSAPPT